MACEKNQSTVSGAAGTCSGIPSPVSKSANYAGKILLAGLLLGGGAAAGMATVTGIKKVKWIMDRIKKAEAERTERRKEASRRFVQVIKNPRRQEMITELQTKYLGRGILRRDIGKALGVADEFEFEEGLYFETELDRNIRVAAGPYGKIVYELDEKNRQQCCILAIEPKVGDEAAMRNGLAAYSYRPQPLAVQSKEGLPSQVDGTANPTVRLASTLMGFKKWAGENQEELNRVIAYTIPAAAIMIGGYEFGIFGRVALSPIQKARRGMQMAANLHQEIQAIRDAKLAAQQLVQKLKDPQRPKAVVALQKKYVGTRLAPDDLISLMGQTPRLFVDDTWCIQGPLGTIYYDRSGEDGYVSIQAILPEAGNESHLYWGLKTVTGK